MSFKTVYITVTFLPYSFFSQVIKMWVLRVVWSSKSLYSVLTHNKNIVTSCLIIKRYTVVSYNHFLTPDRRLRCPAVSRQWKRTVVCLLSALIFLYHRRTRQLSENKIDSLKMRRLATEPQRKNVWIESNVRATSSRRRNSLLWELKKLYETDKIYIPTYCAAMCQNKSYSDMFRLRHVTMFRENTPKSFLVKNV
jgi:hypothetical protein